MFKGASAFLADAPLTCAVFCFVFCTVQAIV